MRGDAPAQSPQTEPHRLAAIGGPDAAHEARLDAAQRIGLPKVKAAPQMALNYAAIEKAGYFSRNETRIE